MKKLSYIGLLLILFSTTTFAQQTEVKRDSVKLGIQLFPEQKQSVRMDNNGFILPDRGLLPVPNRSYIRQDSMTLRLSTPDFLNVPWPSPRLGASFNPFANDYTHSNAFRLNNNSYLSSFSSYTTYPTMGTHIQAGAIYTYIPNERWEFSGGLFSSKYTMPSFNHGSRFDLVFNGSTAYRINDFLRFRIYGEYSLNGERNAAQGYMTPMYPQSSYGAILEIKLNEYVEIHGGVERSYDSMEGKWVTYPILHPVVTLKKKKK